MLRYLYLGGALALLLAVDVQARYARPDLEKIPVERLINNLEQIAQQKPKDAQVRYNLARVHAMAYALKTDMTEVWKGKLEQGAWFGYEPAHIPFKPHKTEDQDRLKVARQHLEKALAVYRDVLKLKEDHLPAQLGLAWCIEQSGQKEDAVKAYRQVIENGWKKEGQLKTGPLGGKYITVEAADYLIPLLDAEKDRDEIQTLRERSEKLKKLPRPITPIVVPLEDGLTACDLEDRTARVRFDVDGTGPRDWSWITQRGAWLVHDPQKTGKVTSGLQLFGNVSFWLFWDNGYEALAALDDNGDGMLTDTELAGLALWHDANSNGICDPGEVRPLAEHGITALSCRWQRDLSHPDGIAYSPAGVTWRDGRTRPTFDIILKQW